MFHRAHYKPTRVLNVRLVVGKPEFDSLAESDKNTLKLIFTASLLDVQHKK